LDNFLITIDPKWIIYEANAVLMLNKGDVLPYSSILFEGKFEIEKVASYKYMMLHPFPKHKVVPDKI
jgi:hypothetical protein